MTHRDKTWLQERYWGKGLSTTQIARLAGVTHQTIHYWMDRLGIPRRTRAEATLRGEKSPMWGRRAETHPSWKGGRTHDGNGYILISTRDHPHASPSGYVYEHRLVMENYLGRFLTPEEVVHHINGILDDNRKENLSLFQSKSAHMKFHRSDALEELTGFAKGRGG